MCFVGLGFGAVRWEDVWVAGDQHQVFGRAVNLPVGDFKCSAESGHDSHGMARFRSSTKFGIVVARSATSDRA